MRNFYLQYCLTFLSIKKIILAASAIFYGIIALAQPTITSFSPTSGPVGTIDTIYGTNFSTTPANNIVYYGATRATVNSAISTRLIVTVPVGATYQCITVQASGLIAYSAKPFIVTFGNGNSTGFSSGSFAGNVDFTTGINPISVAVSDLDGDGKPDLAIANKSSTTISILRNIGTSGAISFGPKIDSATGSSPTCVAIGDLDADGKPDIAIANNLSNTISVFRNVSTTGTVSFATKVDFATNGYPLSIAIGDLNGDGKPDLVVSSQTSGISVFRNTFTTSGTISFASKVDFGAGSNPTGIAIGDLDVDGKPDIVVANSNSHTISILRNTCAGGTVSFAVKVDFATGTNSYPFGVAIGDLDADGKPDLVIANQLSNTISIFRDTSTSGSISFASRVDFITGNNPHNITLGDLDGDGKLDIAVANNNSSSVSLYKNKCTNGIISFNAKMDFLVTMAAWGLAICDVDSDGKPDIVATNESLSSVAILKNTGSFLPIKLISFTGSLKDNFVYLTWETASEINNDRFDIERSDDGKSFRNIGSVNGNGTTNSMSNYRFADHISNIQSLTSNLYYRLNQVDFDGKSTLSDVKVVNLNQVNNDWNIYPNPVTNELFIKAATKQNENEVLIEIFDLKGTRLIGVNQPIDPTDINKIDISNLDAGMYFIKLDNSVIKFIKNN